MSVVATGFFDGVHRGHRIVIDTLVREARKLGEESVVITFWPHPRNVLQNGARELRLLSSLDEKKRLLLQRGVDRVEVLDFTRGFSHLTAEQYLRDVVKRRFGANAVVLGYDNRMGSDGLSRDEIIPLAESLGLRVVGTPALSSSLVTESSGSYAPNAASASPASVDSTVSAASSASVPAAKSVTVSSTKIREALREGRVEDAAQMLGYSYSIHGVVVAGNQMGRRLGFPTANMRLYDPLKLIPANGVYLVEVCTLGARYYGMCNIGFRPTVSSGKECTLETHIFDFDEQIYGLDISVAFVRRIRDERHFASLDGLMEQLRDDERVCRDMTSAAVLNPVTNSDTVQSVLE